MPSKNSRTSYLWYLMSWIILLSTTIIAYHFVGDFVELNATEWTFIDQLYVTLRILLITAIIANIVSLLLREIKQHFAHESMFVRKFLPTLRFTILLVIWIIGGFILLESLQINTDRILTGAGIGGVIFALASRDVIANLLGSMSIIMSKTFEIGDTIRIKNIEGIVEEITLNYTKIMSIDGKVVYLPNKTISNESLENLTRRRFFVYTYKVPFKKTGNNPQKIQDAIMLIEGKISEFSPIEIEIKSEIPNANDFVYIFEVKVPEENEEFDREIREFLIPFIFSA